jgi:hypothetical protein
MAQEKTKVIILGQVHQDPAPFVASYNLIKKCVDNGIKVACAYENKQPLNEYIREAEQGAIFRNAVYELKSPNTAASEFKCRSNRTGQVMSQESIPNIFRDREKILHNNQGYAEILALLKYINSNNIDNTPLDNKDITKDIENKLNQFEITANTVAVETDSQEKGQEAYLQLFEPLMHSVEQVRIDHMQKQINQLSKNINENGVIVVFNMGMMHQERLAKHLEKEGSFDVQIIQCNPHEIISNKIIKQEMATAKERKAALEKAVDSPEIQQMPVKLNVVTLEYNPTSTQLVLSNDYSNINSVTLGEFNDFNKINKHLDRIIPNISIVFKKTKVTSEIEEMTKQRGGIITSENENSTITLRCDQFDAPIREKLGFEKTRLNNITQDKRIRLNGLHDSIITCPDNNQKETTFLCYYPKELKKSIQDIANEKEIKGQHSAKIAAEAGNNIKTK